VFIIIFFSFLIKQKKNLRHLSIDLLRRVLL